MRRHVRRWKSLIEGAFAEEASGAETLRARFTADSDPARSRAALREKFAAAIEAAEGGVDAANLAYDSALEAEDRASLELDDAEIFAEDPWADFSVANYESSTEIRKARERAQNARQLVTDAEERFAAAQHEVEAAWQRYLDALTRRDQLRGL